jgi:hypothetical protein
LANADWRGGTLSPLRTDFQGKKFTFVHETARAFYPEEIHPDLLSQEELQQDGRNRIRTIYSRRYRVSSRLVPDNTVSKEAGNLPGNSA